jgi:hypothetical protein
MNSLIALSADIATSPIAIGGSTETPKKKEILVSENIRRNKPKMC